MVIRDMDWKELEENITDKKVTLFYCLKDNLNNCKSEINKSDSEMKKLDKLEGILKSLSSKGYDIKLLLMPADFCREINDYEYLEEIAFEKLSNYVDLEIKPWSQIKAENKEEYEKMRFTIDMNFLVWKKTMKNGELMCTRECCIEQMITPYVISKAYEDPIKINI